MACINRAIATGPRGAAQGGSCMRKV